MDSQRIRSQILPILPGRIGEYADRAGLWENLEEIRLRLNRPVGLTGHLGELFLHDMIADREMMTITFQKISRYSAYACADEIREGFITLPGGHRAGLCGRFFCDKDGNHRLRDISSVNIRISRPVFGCSKAFFHKLNCEDRFLNTLVISPPGYGKTTLLRDIIVHISEGNGSIPGRNVSVADERGEIGGTTPEGKCFYLGRRTDLMDRCPKAEGMMLLLRTMGPSVIAADEIGSKEETEAMYTIRNSGCALLISAHGRNREEVLRRPVLGEYISREPFERYVVIEKKGEKREVSVYDGQGALL